MTTTSLDLEAALLELTSGFPADGPGGVVAVARAGEVEVVVPFGLASVEHGVANTADSVFYVASTSKQFVAAAVALLEQDGALSWDDPIARWLPELAHLGDIRVHHLVHHTSGIRDKYALGALGAMPEEAYSTDEGTLAMLRRQRTLNFAPGERFEYSNSGYFLLAQLVERVSGQGFADFADARLFDPVGMTATRFRSDPTELVPGRASGYAADPATGAPKVHEYTWTSLGPGGVISTATSLARWGLVWQGEALPGLADRLAFVRPFTDGTTGSYGYGVMLGEHAGRPLVRHAGGVHGFQAEMLQLPQERLTVVVLCNSGAIPAPLLADKALALVVPAGATASVEPVGEPVPADELAGVYVSPGEGSVATVTPTETGLLLELATMRVPVDRGESGWVLPNGYRVAREAGTLVVTSAAGVALRFDQLASAPAVLSELSGDYVSDELATVLTVSDGPDGLVAAWPDKEPTPLDHVAGDLYRVALRYPGVSALVRFLGEGTRADALRLSTERATGTVLTRR